MKKLLSLLVCTLLLSAPAANAQAPRNAPWSVYTIKGEDFSVALPIFPAMKTRKETRTRPQKDRKRRVLNAASNGIVYIIQVVENPKPRLSLDTFIQEQAVLNSAEKLTYERDLTLDGNAGKAFVYPDGKGMVQFFATEGRLYDVRAYGAYVDDPRIKTFFRYFTLKETKGSYEVVDNDQSGSFDTADQAAYIGKDVDTKVRLIKKPEPSYSDIAKSEQITGTVILKCVFASDGTVTGIRVIQGLPGGLTERAIEAARKIKFIPATKDGRNVSMWMQLEYNFNLY